MPHYEFTRQADAQQQIYFQGWTPAVPLRAVVCLTHGLGEHSGRYAHVAAALNDAGYALLGFDLAGHGKTSGLRGHTPPYDRVLDGIGRLLDEAAERYPDTPRFLYGHSLGGSLVLNYALRRRPAVAGIIATSPGLRTATPPPVWKVTMAQVMYRLWPALCMANGLELAGLARDPAVIAAYRADPLVHDRISARLGWNLLQSAAWALAHAAEFPPVPLLLVHGSADRITSADATREFASKVHGDCTLKIWDGFYHETHNEPEKAEVLGFMVDWLQRHTK